MNNYICEMKGCDYYRFTNHGRDIHRSINYRDFQNSSVSLAQIFRESKKKYVTILKAREEKRHGIGKVKTDFSNHFLSRRDENIFNVDKAESTVALEDDKVYVYDAESSFKAARNKFSEINDNNRPYHVLQSILGHFP